MVEAGTVPTVINVDFTFFSFKPITTLALVAVNVIPAYPIILTGARVAVVNVPLALDTSKTRKTLAEYITDFVVAFLGVLVMAGQRPDIAVINIYGTVAS